MQGIRVDTSPGLADQPLNVKSPSISIFGEKLPFRAGGPRQLCLQRSQVLQIFATFDDLPFCVHTTGSNLECPTF